MWLIIFLMLVATDVPSVVETEKLRNGTDFSGPGLTLMHPWAGSLLSVRYGNEAAPCPTVFRRCRLSLDTPPRQRQYGCPITFATHNTCMYAHMECKQCTHEFLQYAFGSNFAASIYLVNAVHALQNHHIGLSSVVKNINIRILLTYQK